MYVCAPQPPPLPLALPLHPLQDELPRLAAHFTAEGLEACMFSTHWFNTIFAYTLPFNHLLRVWDVFMLEGSKVRF